ncbi:MAG: hypothetical protein HKN17_11015 [Rhodothermales bacterium]|nr:hypothetical protein [Rhodothermales bacterium]
MMAAHSRKSAQRTRPAGGDRFDLRAQVDREHSVERKLKLLARYAYLGATDVDRLPCVFRTIGDEIEVAAKRGAPYDPFVRADRRLVLACGAALFRLRIAIQHVGHLPIVRTFPNPLEADRLAVIRVGPRRAPAPDVEAMFDHMSAAGLVASGETAPERAGLNTDLIALRRDARREGAVLKVVRMQDDRTPIELVDDTTMASNSDDVRIVVGTARDLTPDHLNAGQALERILLGPASGALSVDAGFDLLNQPEARLALREFLGVWPQALLSTAL